MVWGRCGVGVGSVGVGSVWGRWGMVWGEFGDGAESVWDGVDGVRFMGVPSRGVP